MDRLWVNFDFGGFMVLVLFCNGFFEWQEIFEHGEKSSQIGQLRKRFAVFDVEVGFLRIKQGWLKGLSSAFSVGNPPQ